MTALTIVILSIVLALPALAGRRYSAIWLCIFSWLTGVWGELAVVIYAGFSGYWYLLPGVILVLCLVFSWEIQAMKRLIDQVFARQSREILELSEFPAGPVKARYYSQFLPAENRPPGQTRRRTL